MGAKPQRFMKPSDEAVNCGPGEFARGQNASYQRHFATGLAVDVFVLKLVGVGVAHLPKLLPGSLSCFS